MNYQQIPSPNYYPGRTDKVKYIVIHHWDDPAKKPRLEGVVNHFLDRKVEVSAHYIVTDKKVIQMVQEKDTAWHAMQANPYTIGIEVDPNVPGDTYATVGALVKDIRSRYGNLPLKKHSDFNQTSCPGNLDIARIDREAKKVTSTGGTTMSKVDKADLDAIYLYGPLGRKRKPGEGEDVYLNKEVSFVLRDHYNSKEARDKRAKAAKPVATKPDPDGSKWRNLKSLLGIK